MTVKMRQYVERQIITVVIREAIKAGYFISVNDGEETTLVDSRSENEILQAMFTTDEDSLFVRNKRSPSEKFYGWIKFVYGNDGYDVLHDYSTNLEHIMPEVNKEIEKWD